MHILLVDDDPIGMFLTKKILKREGFSDTVTSFQSSVEGLSFLRGQISAGKPPQVILLDLNMPLMDGWAFLEALSPYEAQLHSQCLIYLLTSSLAPYDLARAKEHPLVVELIQKPLDSLKTKEMQEQVEGIFRNFSPNSGVS